MAELDPTTPFAGLRLPLSHGQARLSAITPGRITAIAPWPGRTGALRAALGDFPGPGKAVTLAGLRLVWAGRDMAFAFGDTLPEGLQDHAALTDQSDAWAGLALEGASAQDVLARLIAIDLRALPAPATARTLLAHLPLLLERTGETRFQLWSYRSMAASLVEELERAMRNVAARKTTD